MPTPTQTPVRRPWRAGGGRPAVLALLLSLVLGARAGESALLPVPPLQQRVTDATGTLGAEQAAAIEAELAAFEQRKGSQIAVLIVPTTAPETIEQYGIRVAEAWKLGRKGVDDGALLLVAKNDRRLRIEVGYGLEGALNDATAKRIVAETITPRFRAGDYAGGIAAGVQQMIAVVDGEPLPPPPQRNAASGEPPSGLAGLLVPFLVLCFLGQMLRRLFGAGFAALTVGGVTGLVAFYLLSSMVVAALVAVIAAVVALVLYLGGGGGGYGFGGGGASGNW